MDIQTVEYVIETLMKADEEYFNNGYSFFTDAEYDELKRGLQKEIPHHPYFKKVGANPTGIPVKLPYVMGSLDQLYTASDLNKWMQKTVNILCRQKWTEYQYH